jgi:hypothetical protein
MKATWGTVGVAVLLFSVLPAEAIATTPAYRTLPIPASISPSVNTIACISTISCFVGGGYLVGKKINAYNKATYQNAFIMSETNGKWGNPIKVPGLPQELAGTWGFSEVQQIVCPTKSYCYASGVFANFESRNTNVNSFFISEHNSVWGKVRILHNFFEHSLVCPVQGSCMLGGSNSVVTFSGGAISSPILLPPASDGTGVSSVSSISCVEGLNCAIVGTLNSQAAYVSDYTGGAFTQISTPLGLDPTGDYGSGANGVTCVSAGNCTAVGTHYNSDAGMYQPFVVTEQNYVWGAVADVPNVQVLEGSSHPSIGGGGATNIWCSDPANCVTLGTFPSGNTAFQKEVFISEEIDGVWQDAQTIPSLLAVNTGQSDGVTALQCISTQNCLVCGFYEPTSTGMKPYFIVRANDIWKQIVLPTSHGNYMSALSVIGIGCSSQNFCTVLGINDANKYFYSQVSIY